jgi:hypothetical protein
MFYIYRNNRGSGHTAAFSQMEVCLLQLSVQYADQSGAEHFNGRHRFDYCRIRGV